MEEFSPNMVELQKIQRAHQQKKRKPKKAWGSVDRSKNQTCKGLVFGSSEATRLNGGGCED